jgi:hypothetical protein
MPENKTYSIHKTADISLWILNDIFKMWRICRVPKQQFGNEVKIIKTSSATVMEKLWEDLSFHTKHLLQRMHNLH